jgi:RHS repeat-associated protein
MNFYVFADHISAPLVLASLDGQIAWDWRSHDPFGNNTPLISTLLPAYDHRFPGQIADSETGTFYNYYRDYDPQTGRYIESDPIGLIGGINTYGYVGGNPVSNSDSAGLATDVRVCYFGVFCGPPIHPPGTIEPTTNQPWTSVIDDGDGRGRGREECKPAKKDVEPNDLCEQMALAEAKAGAGTPIMGSMGDEPRLVAHYGPGPWIKKQHTHTCSNGKKLVIHYFSNGKGLNVELKFK